MLSKNYFSISLIVVTFLSSFNAVAKPSSYLCEVIDFTKPNEDGEFRRDSILNTEFGNLRKLLTGKRFTINRENGSMEGLLESRLMNVIDKGSKQSGFKSFSRHLTSQLTYVLVEEYVDSDKKPFLIVDHNEIYSGICQ